MIVGGSTCCSEISDPSPPSDELMVRSVGSEPSQMTAAGVSALRPPSSVPWRCDQRLRENGNHALRHFYASTALHEGESIKAFSEYLGHADPGFTLRAYTHLVEGSAERTKRAVDAVFGHETPPADADDPASTVEDAPDGDEEDDDDV